MELQIEAAEAGGGAGEAVLETYRSHLDVVLKDVRRFPRTTYLAPDPAEPFSAVVFKTVIDRYAGTLSVMRVVSGKLTPDTPLVARIRRDGANSWAVVLDKRGDRDRGQTAGRILGLLHEQLK